jgi:hypothetical protein
MRVTQTSIFWLMLTMITTYIANVMEAVKE